MDSDAWRVPLPTHKVGWLESTLMHFCLEFSFRQYTPVRPRFGNKLTLVDILGDVDVLPPLQLHCGDRDVLVRSNRRLFALLAKRNFQVEMHEHDARHCYFGFPPAWLPKDDTAAKDTLASIVTFFARQTRASRQQGNKLFRRRVVRSLGAQPHKPPPHPKRWWHKNLEQHEIEFHVKRFPSSISRIPSWNWNENVDANGKGRGNGNGGKNGNGKSRARWGLGGQDTNRYNHK